MSRLYPALDLRWIAPPDDDRIGRALACVDEEIFLRDIQRLIHKEIAREVVKGFEPDPNERPEPIVLGRMTIGVRGNGRGNGPRPGRGAPHGMPGSHPPHAPHGAREGRTHGTPTARPPGRPSRGSQGGPSGARAQRGGRGR